MYLFWYHFVKHMTIILYLHVASCRDVLDSVIQQHGMHMYAHTIGFLCTCLHSLLGTLCTCCIACTQCIMTPLTSFCMLTFAPLSNNTWTHSMCPASEAIISAVSPSCNDKCISSWEYHQCQIHTTHQSDREYTRTSITHSSTTHSTDTKKAPLGGTYSAPSYPMMSYISSHPFLYNKPHPSIRILYTWTRTVDMYKDPTVQPQNKVHCAEFNITGTW